MRKGRIRRGLVEKEGQRDIPLHVPPIAPQDFLLFQRDEDGDPRVFLIGWTDGAEGRVVEVRFDPRHARHSPGGFEWGYGGSGPAELARYLAYGVARHIQLPRDQWDDLDYQRVKWEVVACTPWHGSVCPAREIYKALGLLEDAQSKERERMSGRGGG
jgi:hypothetical protein